MTTERRPKATFDVPERIRRALAIFAAEQGSTIGEAITFLVERQLKDQLERADQAMSEGKPMPKPRRGRKARD
ncbi:MAG: hypothetical protein KGL39_33825 [Patescibacteria group bacterium]|nr:hypothetical protein [Patescibacteria group bacterium]